MSPPSRTLRRRTRRLRVVLALVATATAAACTGSSHTSPTPPNSSSPVAPSTKPNIVFVLTDDLATNLVPYMPHVIAMEHQGATFTHYFVVDSLCCPSRSAIFTGQYPHDDGVFTNSGRDGGYAAYNRHGDPARSFGVALHNAGYRTALLGKYLNGYQPTDRKPPGWDYFASTGSKGYGEFNYTLNDNGKLEKYGHKPQDYLTDVLAQKAQQFVDSSAGTGKPFAMEIASFAPHGPFTPAPRDKGTFAGLTVPRTPAYNRKPTDAPEWLRQRPPISAARERVMDKDFESRVEAVQDVDRMIGDLRNQLQHKGLLQDTYFVFSSDNGLHMGDYGLLPGKQTAFDTDIHVPLVITGPGITPGRTIDRMTESIDLAPTFESIGGATPTDTPDGTSLMPLLLGTIAPGEWRQDAVLIEHHRPHVTRTDPDKQTPAEGYPPSYEALRTPTALYVEYQTGEREYYNLVKDPYELHNIVSTTPARIIAPLAKRLHALEHCHDAAACEAASMPG